MSPNSNKQTPIEYSRGALVVIAVILGIGAFESLNQRSGDRNGFAFGSWTGPTIHRILDERVESEILGVKIEPVPGYAFFLVDKPNDGERSTNIAFINRAASILGEIRPFDPSRHNWPPKPIDFGAAVSIKFAGKEPADTPGADDPGAENVIIDVGPMSDFRMQVQTILYDNAKITWASPRKSPAWPLRIHAGKCELGPRTLLIFVYEMQAKNPIPNYQEGPIAAIAGALRPL